MTRNLALTVSLCLAGAAAALAQTHPVTHEQGRSHDSSDHSPVDPSQHAAMHALVGNWTGTSSAPGASAHKLALAVATDKAGNMTLKMKADEPIRAGAATSVALEGNTLHWTQQVSGTPCQATAVVTVATPHVPETMKGNMACGHGDITFELQKTKG